VKSGMCAFEEELFGPVVAFTQYDDIEQAVVISNKSRFGLGVSLMTADLKLADQLIPRFDDGAVFINNMVKSDPRLPFGGTKASGYGRELGSYGIAEFANIKTVHIT